jgi:hypothetical protein
MRLIYLVANAAYVFVYGDSLVPMLDVRFFDSREAAVAKAAEAGLTVARNGKVSVAA